MIFNPVVQSSGGGVEYAIMNTTIVDFGRDSATAGEILDSLSAPITTSIRITTSDGTVIPYGLVGQLTRAPGGNFRFVMPASNVTIENV